MAPRTNTKLPIIYHSRATLFRQFQTLNLQFRQKQT